MQCAQRKRPKSMRWVVCISTEIDYYYISVINFQSLVHNIGTCDMWCVPCLGIETTKCIVFLVGLFIFILTTATTHFYAIKMVGFAEWEQQHTKTTIKIGDKVVSIAIYTSLLAQFHSRIKSRIFIEIHLAERITEPFYTRSYRCSHRIFVVRVDWLPFLFCHSPPRQCI